MSANEKERSFMISPKPLLSYTRPKRVKAFVPAFPGHQDLLRKLDASTAPAVPSIAHGLKPCSPNDSRTKSVTFKFAVAILNEGEAALKGSVSRETFFERLNSCE